MSTAVARCTVTAVVILKLHTRRTIQARRRRDVTFSDIIEATLSLTCWRTRTIVTAKCIRTLTVVAKVSIQAFVDVSFTACSIKVFSAPALVTVLMINTHCIALTRIRIACVVTCGINTKKTCYRLQPILDSYIIMYMHMYFFIVRGLSAIKWASPFSSVLHVVSPLAGLGLVYIKIPKPTQVPLAIVKRPSCRFWTQSKYQEMKNQTKDYM